MPDDKDIVVINDNEWKDLDFKALKDVSKKYFDKHLKGQVVTNENNNAIIILAKRGWYHTFYNNIVDYETVVIFKELIKVIKRAEFIGFGDRNKKDSKSTLGYLNYLNNVLINNKVYVQVNISIRIDIIGNFYYDHYIKKKSPPLYR